MKNNLLTLFFVITLSISSIAQTTYKNNPIVTAVPSLSIAPDARGGGMGDVGAATTPDVNSQYWNPAKYAFAESETGVSLSYTPWLRKLVSDIDLAYLSGYYKLDQRQAVSMSLRYFSLGDITLMDQLGIPQGSVKPNEFAIDAAYSLKLSEKLSAAVALRFINSDLNNGQTTDMSPGQSYAADISGYYRTNIPLQGTDGTLGIGLNISNIGSKISYDYNASSNFIPTNLRLGASFDYPIDNYNKISISGDINKLLVPTPSDSLFKLNPKYYDNMGPIDGIFSAFTLNPDKNSGGFGEKLQEIMWSVGAEYAYNNQFFVRGGYFHESVYKGNRQYFTAGAGFKLNVFQLDASYVISTSQTNPLDQTLRFSLSFDLFGLKNLVK